MKPRFPATARLLVAAVLSLLVGRSAVADVLDKTAKINGATVEYKVVLPKDYDPAKAYPGVLAFPGGGQAMNVTSADQDRHPGRRGQLTGRYQRELIQQVARVLDDAGHPPRPAVGVPGAPDAHAIQGRGRAGHCHLPRAGWGVPGD